jgi:LysR family transcriptional regulator, carnitine catabolism transcriptional activator
VDRRQLEYFLEVADHRSFTTASRALHVAQPSVSQTIKGLERELGVQLFHRLPQRVCLTTAGEALVGPARQALRDFDAAQSAVLNVADLATGRLDIVAHPSVAPSPLAEILSEFHTRFPGVLLRIETCGFGEIDLLRRGDVELAMTLAPVATANLEVVEFPVEEVVAALPPSSRWAHGSTLPVHELAKMDMIAVTAGKSLLTQLLYDVGVSPRFVVETVHRDGVIPLVIGGVGVAIIPAGAAPDARVRGAAICRLEPRLVRHVLLIHRRAALTPAAAAFVDLTVDLLAAGVPGDPVALA